MAPAANYYSKRELGKIGIEGFALIDEFYGGGGRWKGTRKPSQLPNYAAAYATNKVTSRPTTPPPRPSPPAAHAMGGSSRKLQEICSYTYSPTESLVCWTPVVAATTETTTVIRGYEAAGKLQGGHGGAVLMDNYNQY